MPTPCCKIFTITVAAACAGLPQTPGAMVWTPVLFDGTISGNGASGSASGASGNATLVTSVGGFEQQSVNCISSICSPIAQTLHAVFNFSITSTVLNPVGYSFGVFLNGAGNYVWFTGDSFPSGPQSVSFDLALTLGINAINVLVIQNGGEPGETTTSVANWSLTLI